MQYSHILQGVKVHTGVQLPFFENEKNTHSLLNSSIVLNHEKLCLDLCNKHVGNNRVSEVLHGIRMRRESG